MGIQACIADVAVIGAGPVGLGFAAAASAAGMRVALIDPAPERAWPNVYGMWGEEADALGVPAVARWEAVRVRFDEGEPVRLARPYVRVDGARLQEGFWQAASGVSVLAARAVGWEPEAGLVQLGDGAHAKARVVVDASGHQAVLAKPARAPRTAQVAYGVEVEAEGLWLEAEVCEWMDWRSGGAEGGPPSFLYAQALPNGRFFLEETQLVTDRPLSMAVLEARLDARLRRYGGRVRVVHEVERCHFPMDAAQPVLPEGVLALGGAAAAVHPASGFMLANALRGLPAVVAALSARDDAREGLSGARDAVRPAPATTALFHFGQRALLRMDSAQLQQFFRAFFALSAADQALYLGGQASTTEVAGVMWRMFLLCPWPIRAELSRLSALPGAPNLLRALKPAGGGAQ